MSDTYYIISRALMDKGDSKTNRVLLSNEFIVFTNTIKHLGLGSGYLSGEFPGGTTTVNGAPVTAEVRALWRDLNGTSADGVVVAKTQSAPDGTWILTGLNPALKYDVVGRKAGFNDVIVSNVTPTSMVDITYTGAVIENADFTGADGFFELVGGIPPYSASVVTPLPLGLFPVVNGRQLIIDGTTGADEVASFDVKVTSSNGAEKIIPLQLVVGFKAPQNFKAETVVVNDVFSVVLTWETTNSTQQVKVYRSETPIDMDDLPEPIATLSGTSTTYTDDDVIEDDVFYYMAASVCESFTLYSDGVRKVVNSGDPHWDKVVALLHFDDETDPWNDATGKTWEPIGIVEFAPGKWGGSAGGLSSSGGSYLRSPNTDGVFNLPGQFTFECWFQHTNSGNPYRNIFLGGSSALPGGFAVTVGNKSSITVAEMYGQNVLTAPFTVGDAWYFLAVTRDINNIVRLFIDGVLISQALSTSPLSFSPSGHAHILNHPQGGGSVGRVDELRITKGVARYTENFTPPTEPFPNF